MDGSADFTITIDSELRVEVGNSPPAAKNELKPQPNATAAPAPAAPAPPQKEEPKKPKNDPLPAQPQP
jgi:hypothetical protein